ncbi:hypothetical protein SSOG_06288 [Streptomyces himastatinicus ATCC 53653]|uniref:Peptidase M10 metallopeptidase domain-containing protein n=1 Tax=Streptomyces himastatinicus ATCC 53653 TaxID=457427 RepID=D9WWB8_9ACTN|nr:hypothetical protein [Streptomyces himastatinicus]EFL26574.1 hypothetical protein SSOG_06288 [Streptomyces himastatinicus ATCC 53653]
MYIKSQAEAEYDGGSETDVVMNTICHETGHAVGLSHGAQASPAVGQSDSRLGCMRNTRNADWRDLGSHNTATINATY